MRLLGWTLLVSFIAADTAVAANPLGVYVAAGAGRADVRSDLGLGIGPRFNESATGWTASLGIRPFQFAGVELQYLDFGHPSVTNSIDHIDVRARTPALFGVAYAPLPIAHLDLYAKAGVGRVHVSTTSRPLAGIFCFRDSPECQYVHTDTTSTRFGWGAGALFKMSSSLSLRAEYARFSVPAGNPDLLSLSLTWAL